MQRRAAHKAILEAAAELLLARGLGAVSMDAVAERAGVSKATIYRWWPTKETLALDALYHEWASVPAARDTGSVRGDLLSLLRPWARLAGSRPDGGVIGALLTEAQTDPGFAAEYRERFVEPRRDQAPASLPAGDQARRDPGQYQDRGRARPPLRPALPPAATRSCAAQRPVRPRRHRHRPRGRPSPAR